MSEVFLQPHTVDFWGLEPGPFAYRIFFSCWFLNHTQKLIVSDRNLTGITRNKFSVENSGFLFLDFEIFICCLGWQIGQKRVQIPTIPEEINQNMTLLIWFITLCFSPDIRGLTKGVRELQSETSPLRVPPMNWHLCSHQC